MARACVDERWRDVGGARQHAACCTMRVANRGHRFLGKGRRDEALERKSGPEVEQPWQVIAQHRELWSRFEDRVGGRGKTNMRVGVVKRLSWVQRDGGWETRAKVGPQSSDLGDDALSRLQCWLGSVVVCLPSDSGRARPEPLERPGPCMHQTRRRSLWGKPKSPSLLGLGIGLPDTPFSCVERRALPPRGTGDGTPSDGNGYKVPDLVWNGIVSYQEAGRAVSAGGRVGNLVGEALLETEVTEASRISRWRVPLIVVGVLRFAQGWLGQ